MDDGVAADRTAWSRSLGRPEVGRMDDLSRRQPDGPEVDAMSVPDLLAEPITPAEPIERHVAIPPLENGDRLTRPEFERRYDAMPNLKNAELIEGVARPRWCATISGH
jgi:hypothetical protein